MITVNQTILKEISTSAGRLLARKKVDLNIRECSKIKCVEKEISLLCYVKVSYNTVNKFTISRRIIILWNFKQIFFKE